MVENRHLNLLHLYLVLPLGVTPWEYHVEFWCQKTRVSGLAYDIVCMILCLAVMIQNRRVMDGWTHDDSIYRASIVLCGKNCNVVIKLINVHKYE